MSEISMGRPNEKQSQFLSSRHRYIAYGGARGGGKSWAVRKKAMALGIGYSGIKMLLLRRTLPELRENHILPLMKELKEVANYKETEKAFTFFNGSRLKFGYCDSESDVLQYQGQEYDVIFMDEATQFTEFQFNTLTACLRGANNNPKRFYLTCNPGGVGHAWVKRLFIDRDYKNSECGEEYIFIPAKIYDNKALMENDQGYVKMLENLPTEMRRAWLDGDWNVFAGQYFKEFREDIHVVKPFSIPENWRRYFAMDYGLDMLAGYWIALSPEGRAYVYREIYESELIISKAASKIKEMTFENIYEYIAPGDMWNRRQDTGNSVADIFANHGIFLQKARNSRVSGWLDLREWLKVIKGDDGNDYSNLVIFENCKNLIRTLPLLQYDEKNQNDVASKPHELTHGPDALRYFVSGRPYPESVKEARLNKLPFELRDSDVGNGKIIEW